MIKKSYVALTNVILTIKITTLTIKDIVIFYLNNLGLNEV